MYCNYVNIVKYPLHSTLISDFMLDFIFFPPPAGRLSAAICRLCHGKFSSRSLRNAFKFPQDSISIVEDSNIMSRAPVLFHTDFQQLVGVQLDRDPRLSEFICKKCHVKFYKCHSILIRFLQRVNLPPVGEGNLKPRWVRGTGSENCFYPRCFTIIFPTFRKNVKYPESSVNHGPKSKYALHFFYFLYLFLHQLQKKKKQLQLILSLF